MEDQIFKYIGRTSRIAHRYMGNQLEAFGLTKGQPRILHLLKKHPNLTQKELLALMDIRPATLTRMLQRMEKNQLITRTPSKKDQRVMTITITERGLEAQESAERVFHEIEEEFTALMTEEEKEVLRRVFNKIYQHIKEKEEEQSL